MSNFIFYKWEEVNIKWEDLNELWESVGYILNEDLGISVGAAIENEFELQRKIDKLSNDKKDKLITVMIMLGNKDYKEQKKSNKNIKLTVSDIKTISRNLAKITIKN
jgi:hypothetical protein